MSVRTLSAYAVARNRASESPDQPLSVVDTGEVTLPTDDPATAEEPPTVPTLLAKLVPTEILSLYTVLLGGLSTAITDENPLLAPRWAAFGLLVLFSAGFTWFTYVRKAGESARMPLLELLGVTVAAIGLGLSMPESPLYEVAPGAGALAWVLVVGFAALGINAMISVALKKPAASS